MRFELLKSKETQQLIKALELDSDINLAILFGSYAKGTFNLESDIDLAIKCNKPFLENKKIQIIQLIAQIFGRPVDLIDMQTVGEPLLSQIVKDGIVIKGSAEAFTEIAIKNVYANEDFLPYIKRSLKVRREK